MQGINVASLPRVFHQFQNGFQALMNRLNSDPKIAEFMNTSLGKYFNNHPFLALSLLVFIALAIVPVGLFLVFVAVTFISATVGFVFLEVFLLTLGGATLLCILSGVALAASIVSIFLSAVYITISNVLHLYYSRRNLLSQEKKEPTNILGSKDKGG
ncbi:hypothetical protein GJAV_G00217880 [Gymnothorax javanicus]|nr:hypothetical protein GJAV_G00217880 [Gymnothorax javanicus]